MVLIGLIYVASHVYADKAVQGRTDAGEPTVNQAPSLQTTPKKVLESISAEESAVDVCMDAVNDSANQESKAKIRPEFEKGKGAITQVIKALLDSINGTKAKDFSQINLQLKIAVQARQNICAEANAVSCAAKPGSKCGWVDRTGPSTLSESDLSWMLLGADFNSWDKLTRATLKTQLEAGIWLTKP